MKSSKDIENLRLTMELSSAHSRIAFLEEKLEGCVSREDYDAKCAECDAVVRESAAKDKMHEDEVRDVKADYEKKLAEMQSSHDADMDAMNVKLKEYQEVQELLKTENIDFKTLFEFWQGHQFGASSEVMTDMMDKVVGQLPTTATGMLADVLNIVDRLNHSDGEVKLPAPVVKAEKKHKPADDKDTSGKSSGSKNCKTTKCVDVREVLGPDFSDLPPGYKVVMRKGKPDVWVIELIFMDKAHAHSKKFEIARCNIPGDDPRNSKYPPMLFDNIPVDASFASFYLEMKFGYNIPESRIKDMLEKAGCTIPQPTLNRWMHAVMAGLHDLLMPEMIKAIKESRFTHNDETRILVRSQEEGEEKASYKTEYIHGILSPEANLFIMLYENGTRSHEVQLDVFRDSNIIAFLADRCPLYTALITALSCQPLIRGACWVHFRRYLLHAYCQEPDKLEIMIHLIARLFAAEKIISKMKNLTETQRVRERQRMCKPLVDAMFAFMRKVRDAGTEYGVLARRAADYLLNDEKGFYAFLDCGLLEIGNNAVERCFRNIAKGRENWLQCGSHEAAKHTAFMYSLVESCNLNDIDFGQYIETVLRRIQNGDSDIHGMLPNVITLPNADQNTSAA